MTKIDNANALTVSEHLYSHQTILHQLYVKSVEFHIDKM